MGSGFLEGAYQECFAIEFATRNITDQQQPKLQLTCRDQVLAQNDLPDFDCFGTIILEIKAVRVLADDHQAQLHHD